MQGYQIQEDRETGQAIRVTYDYDHDMTLLVRGPFFLGRSNHPYQRSRKSSPIDGIQRKLAFLPLDSLPLSNDHENSRATVQKKMSGDADAKGNLFMCWGGIISARLCLVPGGGFFKSQTRSNSVT